MTVYGTKKINAVDPAPGALNAADLLFVSALAGVVGDTYSRAASEFKTFFNTDIASSSMLFAAGLSVVGRAANTAGVGGEITAGTDGHVLRRSGTTLGFGTLAAGAFASNTAPVSTVAVSATAKIVGRTTAGAGAAEEIAPDATLVLSALVLGRAALTGDVTAAAGSNATTIATNAVSNTKFRQSAGLSVVGRSANTTGDVADITAVTSGHVLRLSGTTLGFGTLIAASFADNTIAATRMAMTATDRLVGRQTGGAGAGEEITCTAAGRALIDDADASTQRNTLSLPYPAGYNFIRNPSADFWQRGSSVTSGAAAAYAADGWAFRRASGAAGSTCTRSTGILGSKYAIRLQRTAANSSTQAILLGQVLPEGVVRYLAGKYVRISAMFQAGADYSGGGLFAVLTTGTAVGETPDISTGFATGNASQSATLGTPTTTAVRGATVATMLVPTNALEAMVSFSRSCVGTAGAADYVDVTNILLEVVNDVNAPVSAFRYTPAAEQWPRILPYYQKSFDTETDPVQNAGSNTGEVKVTVPVAGAVTARLGTHQFMCPMRGAPTITTFNPNAANAQVRDQTAAADCSATAVSNITEKGFDVQCTANAGTALGNSLAYHWTASADFPIL